MIYIIFRLVYTISKEVISMNELNIEVGARITELRKGRGYTRESCQSLQMFRYSSLRISKKVANQ